MDISEGTTTDDLWTPYKELVSVVESYLASDGDGAPYAVHTFESVLRRHKQTFLSLFKNPAKNATSREEIRRGITEGVTLPSVGKTILSKELVDEAIIISDMYNVSEYLALELLHTAQRQMPRHPGLPRGLVAIILYYDGRRAIVHALKEIMMAQEGVSWSISGREDIVKYVSRYAETLVSDGAVSGALEALRRFTLEGELALLQANRALPPHPHSAHLRASIDNTRKLLAGVVFSASAQRGLNRDIILRILSEQSTSPTLEANGALDEVSLGLQMALLYALDLSVLHRREDGEELAKKLPLIQDPDLISVLLDELSPPTNQENMEKTAGVRALCQLALGLALAALKRAPQSLKIGDSEVKCELLDQDEVLVDAAIDGKVFEYLDEAILSTEYVSKEEYYQRRIHILITDFIVLMHSKLMEMRVKAEESARAAAMFAREGLRAPAGTAGTRLDALLRAIEKLYAKDPLRLRDDYWVAAAGPTGAGGGRGSGGGGGGGAGGSRAATLYKFAVVMGGGAGGARALAALAVPQHTWALLARRDALSAHHALTALARYYCNLRVDAAPFAAHAHAAALGASAVVPPAARPGKLLVRQEEVEAMIAALKLIAAVAREDQAACASICENLQWDAVNVMFGLVSCHIPLQLKAQLLLTLGALGGWAGTAGRVWAALEHSALVTSDMDKCPLSQELNEVECRVEEYPVSIAFLQLLRSLCEAGPAPAALGAGSRPPGLQPYLRHVLQRLALPAPHRQYTKPSDKWQILSLSFGLFALWLEQYEPAASDFLPAASPAPGFELLIKLHSESELLRLVLATLEEAYAALDRQPYVLFPGKNFVEQCLEASLQILERGLALERSLQAAAAEANRSLMIIGLSKLILTPEGPDNRWRAVTWCRVVGLVERQPRAAARAVALLGRALAAPPAAAHLLHALGGAPHAASDVRHAFVLCLEADDPAPDDAAPPDDEEGPVRRAQRGVVALVLRLLPTAAPNLAHFLLGYRVDDVPRSRLNEPGVGGAPRTLLHAVLDALDARPAAAAPDALVEAYYRLVAAVCAAPHTAAPALRLLRARDYFLARHVRRLAAAPAPPAPEAELATLGARSWVLRAAACEAAAAGAARAVAASAALLAALSPRDWGASVLRKALHSIPTSVPPPPEPRWELFDAAQLRKAIGACETTGVGGAKRVDVPRLRALLARELAAAGGERARAPPVAREVRRVLEYAAELNARRDRAAAAVHCFDSWRQLVEMAFCATPAELLEAEARRTLALNVVRELLAAVPAGEAAPRLAALASGTVLLLLVDLRRCHLLRRREAAPPAPDLDSTPFGSLGPGLQTNSLALKAILGDVLEWIAVSSGCEQRTRVNLYGALLNLMRLATGGSDTSVGGDGDADGGQYTYVSRLDASLAPRGGDAEGGALRAALGEALAAGGAGAVRAACGDAAGGGAVVRALALAVLHALLDLDPRTPTLATLADHGYLRAIIDSLTQDDAELRETLEPNPKSLRALYIYESKMALLMKIAGSRAGAETALAQGAVAALAEMRSLDCHPDVHAPVAHNNDFLPPPAARFRQILVPAMGVCSALITSLGGHNHSGCVHVLHALLAHLDTIDLVLRAAHPTSSTDLLIEVEAITGVVSLVCDADMFSLCRGESVAPALLRLRTLMLHLLPRFQRPPPTPHHTYYKIVFNVLLFARNMFPEWGAEGGGAGASSACLALLSVLTRLHHHEEKLLATDQHRLHALPTMTLDDIKKLVPECGGQWAEARARGAGAVSAALAARRRQLQRCGAALDLAAWLVWAHLKRPHAQHYAKIESSGLTPTDHNVATEELLMLRKELIALFNDRFTEELLDTAKNQPPAQRGFLEVLVKDIKSMIQFSPV